MSVANHGAAAAIFCNYVMGISAFLVQKPLVWAILAAVAVFLLVLMLAVIPTIPKEQEQSYGVCTEVDPSSCEED